MQDIDEMFKVLEGCGATPVFRETEKEYEFSRVIFFELDGVFYTLVWWANICYLSIGGEHSNYIPFTDMEADTCWPSYSNGLRLKNNGIDVIFIAIEKLDWQKDKH
jgi:hypothetical protein